MNPEPDGRDPIGPIDEIRAVLDAPPGEAAKEIVRDDLARLAELRRISDDPCHQATFDRLTAVRLLRITVYGLIEAGDWARAARYTLALDRLERQDARAAQPHAPIHAPIHGPGPRPPAPAPAPAQPNAAAPARSLHRQLKEARRAMRRARAGQQPCQPHPGPAPAPSPRLPFT